VADELAHMSGLINELLSFSKAAFSAAGAPLGPVDIAQLAGRVIEREGSNDARIEVDVPAALAAMAHPELLYRSLANLVRNAIRYAGESGPIVISAAREKNEVVLAVSDEGPGLPQEELESVFKPFYRPELARQRETGGAGLGLAIVRSSIEACGGTVSARNRSPHGLAVEIRLPAATAPVTTPQEAAIHFG
jgi:two-component system, OmpR family, sensor histidine kinase CpxA